MHTSPSWKLTTEPACKLWGLEQQRPHFISLTACSDWEVSRSPSWYSARARLAAAKENAGASSAAFP